MRGASAKTRVVLLALAAGAIAACTGSRIEGLEPSKLPEDVRHDYAVFAQKCSKCHSIARPLTANITDDEQWVMYVNRMRRQPGSGISPEDQVQILRFLRWHAADLRRQQVEKRGGAPAPSTTPSPSPSPPPAPSPVIVPAPPGGGG
jgi:hypothetical protein